MPVARCERQPIAGTIFDPLLCQTWAAAEARIDRLINGADMLERAARIRRYVASVRAANAAIPKPAGLDALESWTEWALMQADSIDPVASGPFIEDLKL
jgi:hypothetical protein